MRYLTLILVFACACNDSREVIEYEPYNGPLRILTNTTIEHSDSAIVRGKLISVELHEFATGDRELPRGGFVEFYDKLGVVTGSLRSDYAYYTKEDDHWKVEGDVQLKNAENGETLFTEELYWRPKEQNVYTEKFVRIETADQILTGIGLTAKQDFSRYVIKNPQGTFNLDE